MRVLKPNDRLILKDKQTLSQQLSEGQNLTGCNVKVVEANNIKTEFSTWYINKLDNDMVLIIQDADGVQELGLYFAIENFIAGDRADMKEWDTDWMFQDDDYATSIESDDGDFQIKFSVWGIDTEAYLSGVTEWAVDASFGVENPELLATEIGNGDRGGLVEMFQGCRVNECEIELMEA